MKGEQDSAFEKMFDQRWFINLARISMLGASLIGLPIAGYFGMRLIDKADKITDTVDETSRKLELLDVSVRFNTEQIKGDAARTYEVVRDHEGRIRVLEAARPQPPRP